MAHDIVRESLRAWDSKIVSASLTSVRRVSSAASRPTWLANHSLDDYLDLALDQSKMDWVKRDQLPNLLTPSP
ncbi:MAG: hypothetical protein U0V48_16645 [Anaerolineales bacterium]